MGKTQDAIRRLADGGANPSFHAILARSSCRQLIDTPMELAYNLMHVRYGQHLREKKNKL